MTLVGKILVIIIMVFALFFLALSTVVFTTATNWRDENAKVKKSKDDLQKKLQQAQAEYDAQKNVLQIAVAARAKAVKDAEARIADLTTQNNRRQTEIQEQRKNVATALEEVRRTQDEAEARIAEAQKLRETLSAVQTQANEFKLRQTELNDQIRILQRELEGAKENNQDLRDKVAILQGALSKAGLPTESASYVALNVPPAVEGYVKRVDAKNTRVEISVGSNDGLIAGHELYVFRTDPKPEYVGKIRIRDVDPNQAVGDVINRYQGKKIREDDRVTTQIKPRG